MHQLNLLEQGKHNKIIPKPKNHKPQKNTLSSTLFDPIKTEIESNNKNNPTDTDKVIFSQLKNVMKTRRKYKNHEHSNQGSTPPTPNTSDTTPYPVSGELGRPHANCAWRQPKRRTMEHFNNTKRGFRSQAALLTRSLKNRNRRQTKRQEK